MRLRFVIGVVGAAVVAVIFALQVSAQECARGALDARYCDRDGDLVADAPTDPEAVARSRRLDLLLYAGRGPGGLRQGLGGFMRIWKRSPARRVQFFPVQSNAAQLEAMRAGRLHVAGFNTGSNPLAVNCAGFVPFATDGVEGRRSIGYEMEIITYPGSGVTKIEDIKGKKMAFTVADLEFGLSRRRRRCCKQNYKLEAGKDYEPVFSGKHDNSVIGVANKDYPAAAIANSVMQRMIERGVVKKDQIVTIYKSQDLSDDGLRPWSTICKPELAAKVKEAFFTFPWDGSELQTEFGKTTPPMQKFLPINYKEHWQVGARDRSGDGREIRLQVSRTSGADAAHRGADQALPDRRHGAERRRPRGAGRPGDRPDRSVRRRQIDADPLRQSAGRTDRRPDFSG